MVEFAKLIIYNLMSVSLLNHCSHNVNPNQGGLVL